MSDDLNREHLLKDNSQESLFDYLAYATIPKHFRIWDRRMQRWAAGHTNQEHIELGTDNVDLHGECMVMNGVLYDQNEPQESDPKRGSLERMADRIVVQGTGLKDVNGREIFEGDLVFVNGEDLSGVVLYNRATESYTLYHPYDGWIPIVLRECTIFGNMFENYNEWKEMEDGKEKLNGHLRTPTNLH